MSLLTIGLSHRSAPLTLLERTALARPGVRDLAGAALAGEHVRESVVLATCNRVEVYAEVSAFHGGLTDLTHALSTVTGVGLEELKDHLYVRYADQAVTHLFSVACGLDSMAVGESQVLGQLRQAIRDAQDAGETGRVLDPLMQQALRVGKRAHAETGIDRAGASLVDAGLRRADAALGGVAGRSVLVVGAGSMSALAIGAVRDAGADSIAVANRTASNAQSLADKVGAQVVPLDRLAAELQRTDLVISCTGALGHVIDVRTASASTLARRAAGVHHDQVYLDLALPRDVDPAVADLDGVQVIDLEVLGEELSRERLGAALDQVRELVDAEVEQYVAQVRAQAVAPTVVALRARAAQVVEAELLRLAHRLPDLEPAARDEVQRTVHRVVEKLLHAPTVRVKQLASRNDGPSYAAALRELFDLDPGELSVVSSVVSEVPLDSDVAALLTASAQVAT